MRAAGRNKPHGVYLDGADLSPVLLGKFTTITRHQPLLWLLPASGQAIALRDGKYSLVAVRAYAFPKDHEKFAALTREVESTLRRNGTDESETRGGTLQQQMFLGFKDKEAERLRGQFIRLNIFSETWIPAIKSRTHARFHP